MIKNTRSLFLHESSECHSSKTIKTINSELFFVAENRQNLCKKIWCTLFILSSLNVYF